MLVDLQTQPATLHEPGLRWWRGDRFTIGWMGHLFLAGRQAGAPSVEALATLLEQRPLAAVCEGISGVFALFVRDGRDESWQIACDNTGLFPIFHDGAGLVGTSFLELATACGATPAEVDPDRIAEFLVQGLLFGQRTFVTRIRQLAAWQVLRLTAGNGGAGPALEEKRFGADPLATDAEFLVRYTDDLARSLADRRVSVDVSGGFDSRLVACLLDRHRVVEEAAISGEPGSADIVLGAAVAERLGLPFFPLHHDLEGLEKELPTVFKESGGLLDLCKFHRDRQTALARRARGIEVFVHGGGGEFLKDLYFHHDFPFYGRRETSLERFYDLRVAPLRLPPGLLGPRGRDGAARARAEALRLFARHRAATNHETCDRISLFVRQPQFFGAQFSGYVRLGLDVAAPFLERANALAALSLPPWSRVMEGWHRRLVTRFRPDIAALPTTDGYTASSRPRDRLRDLAGYAASELRRAANKAGQRLVGRTLLPKAGAAEIDAPGFVPRLRATRQFQEALGYLQDLGVLGPGLAPDRVPAGWVGRVLAAGMCLQHLEQGSARRSTPAASPAVAVS
jgi:asparagine synthetase B (glutamine-hydrolysing)